MRSQFRVAPRRATTRQTEPREAQASRGSAFLAERRGDARRGDACTAFSVAREENAGRVVEGVEDGLVGVLGGLVSRRIGLARRGAFYSATGG